MNPIVKNAALSSAATLAAAVLGFLTSIVGARVLGPYVFGEFSLLVWVFATLVLLVDPGISSATAKFTAELEGARQQAAANRLTWGLLVVQVGVGAFAGVLLAVFSPDLAATLKQPAAQPYLVVLALGLPAAMTCGVLRGRLAGLQRYDLISRVLALTAVLTLAGTIFLLHRGLGMPGLIWLAVGVYLLQLLLLAMLVWKRHPLRPMEAVSTSLVHRVRRYCAGAFIISTFDAIIWQRSETFFLGRYSTVDQIGYYGLAYSISGVLATMLPFAASGVLMPALSHQFGAGERDTMQRIYAAATKYVVILGLPFCLGGIAVAKPAIELIYGGGYAPAVWPLQILLVSGAVVAMAGPTSALFLALGKPYLAGLWGIPIAILNLMLGYTLAGPYGAVGAALANSICQVLGVAAGITYLSHFQKFRLPVGALLRTTMAASLGAGLTYLIVTLLAGWAGLVAAVTASAIVYIPALLLAGALDSSDFAVLRGLASALPLRSGHVTRRLVDVTEAANLRLREVLHTRTR